jgi:hypothetical protein
MADKLGMIALWKWTHAPQLTALLSDYVVGGGVQRQWFGEAEHPGGGGFFSNPAPRRWWPAVAITVLLLGGSARGETHGAGSAYPSEASLADDGSAIDFAWGGDVLLCEDVNSFVARKGAAAPLAGVPELRNADIAVVNLESVVAVDGDAVDSGNFHDLYFRGRPEMLAVLEAAGIDAVVTGNNHALDFGPVALDQEDRLLTAMGLAHPGTGNSRSTACAPTYLESKGIRVALFSVNTTEPTYPAGDSRGGTCYVAPDDGPGWESFRGPIADARSKAHVVLFAPHFRASFRSKPNPADRRVAQRLIDLGADAVLGTGAHALQGLELYHGHLIVHGAGSLLFDFPHPDETALFVLRISRHGVLGVRTVPLVAEHDWTRPADPAEAAKILAETDERSRALDTQARDGTLRIDPQPRDAPSLIPPVATLNPGPAPGPLSVPPSNCTVTSVPAGSAIDPVQIGPLSLVGVDVQPQRLVGPGLLWVTTFWTTKAAVGRDLLLAPQALSMSGEAWQRPPHEPCDWAWPTSRWQPGMIYRDRYPLHPPWEVVRHAGILALAGGYGRLALSVGIQDGERVLGRSRDLAVASVKPAVKTWLTLGVAALAALAGGVGFIVLWRRRTAGSWRLRIKWPFGSASA